jgi:hypothetical protein
MKAGGPPTIAEQVGSKTRGLRLKKMARIGRDLVMGGIASRPHRDDDAGHGPPVAPAHDRHSSGGSMPVTAPDDLDEYASRLIAARIPELSDDKVFRKFTEYSDDAAQPPDISSMVPVEVVEQLIEVVDALDERISQLALEAGLDGRDEAA